MKNAFLVALTAASLAAAGLATAQEPQTNLPRARLSVSMHQIDAQVAQSPEHRATGLMYRKEMPQHEGMLFVFDQPGVQCFWMKNTLIPLSAAFLEDDGTVVNVVDMQPQTTQSHCSARPVRYVLEMNQGWFGKKNVKPGSRITGAAFAAK